MLTLLKRQDIVRPAAAGNARTIDDDRNFTAETDSPEF
jgi:hypothetical protein